MTKYMEPLLKIIILLVLWMVIMRIRYIWSITKKESECTFRNQEGDLSIVIFFLLVMNKSRFDKYQLSYQPLLRQLYGIVVGIFIAYCILQLTQWVVLTKTALISQQGIINSEDIKQCAVKKYMYGYKFSISYTKNGKEKNISFMINKRNKKVVEEIFKEQSINIV